MMKKKSLYKVCSNFSDFGGATPKDHIRKFLGRVGSLSSAPRARVAQTSWVDFRICSWILPACVYQISAILFSISTQYRRGRIL